MRLSPFLFAAAVIAGFAAPALADQPIKVVASISIIGDLVSEIGGDHVAVTTLVGPNGDAHSYEPKPADAKALSQASVLVENGLGLERWMERLVATSGFKGETVIVSKEVKPRLWTGDADEAGELAKDPQGRAIDPHAWQDPKNGILYVKAIVAGLSEADPAHKSDFEAKGATLAAELQAIDTRLAAEFGKLTPAQRRIVTTHDAFGYFGAAYGVTFLAPEGISTESEPSAADIAKIVQQVRDEHIQAIFFENITDPRIMQQIAREAKVEVGGELFSDALSASDGPASTYIKMFENNERAFLSALTAR